MITEIAIDDVSVVEAKAFEHLSAPGGNLVLRITSAPAGRERTTIAVVLKAWDDAGWDHLRRIEAALRAASAAEPAEASEADAAFAPPRGAK